MMEEVFEKGRVFVTYGSSATPGTSALEIVLCSGED